MKDRILISVMSLFMMSFMTSCSESLPFSEKTYKDIYLWVYPSEINLSEYENSGDFQVSTNQYGWEIQNWPSWVNLTETYGYESSNVPFTVDRNNTNYTRSDYITVATNQDGFIKEVKVLVSQPPTPKTAPFTITSIEIGNIDYNGNVINDYGTTIYSWQTKYLAPKLYISVNVPGTYTIYTKLYFDGYLSQGTSSPKGYTNKREIKVTKSTSYVLSTGWGKDTAGNWHAGNYRWEFYLFDEKIGEKSFRIYY